MLEPESKDHEQGRTFIRVIGGILLVIGGLMFLNGISFFFSPFSGNPLNFIWAVFGLPVIGFGLQLLTFGFMGKIARFQANEIAPVGKDTFNYVAKESKGSVQDLAQAIGAGLRGESMKPLTHTCRRCGNKVTSEDRFCDQCGSSLAEVSTCPVCHASHEADARFCPSCGNTLPKS